MGCDVGYKTVLDNVKPLQILMLGAIASPQRSQQANSNPFGQVGNPFSLASNQADGFSGLPLQSLGNSPAGLQSFGHSPLGNPLGLPGQGQQAGQRSPLGQSGASIEELFSKLISLFQMLQMLLSQLFGGGMGNMPQSAPQQGGQQPAAGPVEGPRSAPPRASGNDAPRTERAGRPERPAKADKPPKNDKADKPQQPGGGQEGRAAEGQPQQGAVEERRRAIQGMATGDGAQGTRANGASEGQQAGQRPEGANQATGGQPAGNSNRPQRAGGGAQITSLGNTREEKIQNIVQAANETYPDDPNMAKLAACQAALESGCLSGGSELANKYNNLFGIKGSGDAGSVNMATQEHNGSNYYSTNDNFAAYSSLGSSFDYHRNLMMNDRYRNCWGQSSFEATAHAVKAAGYATDPEYAPKLINLYNSVFKPYFEG